jgi:hypothetical protein
MTNARARQGSPAGRHTRALVSRRRQLLDALRDSRPLLMGSVYNTYQRCGSPTCHCAQGRGHLKTLLVYRIEGRRVCKLVRKADVSWVRKAAERYRRFRKLVRELRTLNREEIELFEALARRRAIEYM